MDGSGRSLVHIGLFSGDGQPSIGPNGADVNQGNVGGLFGLVRRIYDIARRFRFQDKHALLGKNHGAAAALPVDEYGVVRHHPPNDLVPGNAAGPAVFLLGSHPLEHDPACLTDIALVTVMDHHCPVFALNYLLGKVDPGCFERDIRETVDGHARRDLNPEGGISRNGKEALGNRGHISSELGLQRVDIDVGAKMYHGSAGPIFPHIIAELGLKLYRQAVRAPDWAEKGMAETAKNRWFCWKKALWILGFAGVYTVVQWRGESGTVPLSVARLPVETLQGKPAVLDLRQGQIRLLNFWSPGCPPCVAEIPALNGLEALLGGKRFAVVGIAVQGSTAAAVKARVRQLHIRYPLYLEPQGSAAGPPGGIVLTPTSLLVGGDGRVLGRYAGTVSLPVILARLLWVLWT